MFAEAARLAACCKRSRIFRMTTKTEAKPQTYDEALSAIEKVASTTPDGQMLLAALRSPQVKEQFIAHLDAGQLLVKIIMPEYTTLESFPVSFQFLQAPPGVSFTPYILTAVVDIYSKEVVEVFDLSQKATLLKGDKSLPRFRNALRLMTTICGDGHVGWGRPSASAFSEQGVWLSSTAAFLQLMGDGFFPWLKPIEGSVGLFGDGLPGWARSSSSESSEFGRINWLLKTFYDEFFPW